jgi:hypothetical protein
MKIKKIEEKINLESTFYFLNELKPYSKDKPNTHIEFLKSLNLTYEQYVKIAEMMEEYGNSRFEDGLFTEDPGEAW